VVGKADVVHAIDIANGVSVASQDHGRHGLFLLELLDLRRELPYLLLKFEIVLAGSGTSAKEQNSAK
jgi:hypothetical protein